MITLELTLEEARELLAISAIGRATLLEQVGDSFYDGALAIARRDFESARNVADITLVEKLANLEDEAFDLL